MAEGGGTSLLGTKEYWDDSYARELVNFEHTGDIGEVWFGHQSQTRIANWLEKCPHICKKSKILDIGCGNGALLLDLGKRGFEDLMGVDYCEGAIELARQCAKMEGITVELSVADILSIDSSPLNGRVFEVCLDKGTYDVISLTPSNAEERKAAYVHSTATLLKESGLLIVASCNWTEEELRKQFESEYSYTASIPAPKFQFGGHTGQTVSTVVLQKKSRHLRLYS